MSENSTRPHSEKGVGPARRPSTRRIGASGLRNKPKWRSMRLKLAAIWRMSVKETTWKQRCVIEKTELFRLRAEVSERVEKRKTGLASILDF